MQRRAKSAARDCYKKQVRLLAYCIINIDAIGSHIRLKAWSNKLARVLARHAAARPAAATHIQLSATPHTRRGDIAAIFLQAADAKIAAAAAEQAVSVRRESILTKRPDVPVPEQHRRLGKELDKIQRLFHMQCEKQYLSLLSSRDSHMRSVLHYAASAKGTAVEAFLRFKQHRFRDAKTTDTVQPVGPLFPKGGWVSPVTGELWMPVHEEFGQDTEAEGPPDGFISVAELLRARSDASFIDAKDENNAAPLHYATVANDSRAIRCLLSFGAESFSATKHGTTCLDLAANRVVRTALIPVANAVEISCGHKAMRPGVKPPLASTGVPGSQFSRTATGRAAGMAGTRIAQGGDDFDDARSSVTVRKTAAENALISLVANGEDINGRTGIQLQAPLHLASSTGSIDVVQLLLSNGAIVDICDAAGRTPLHLAAELGTEKHLAVVKLLYDAGADINATSSNRQTPLHLAASGGPNFKAGKNLIPKPVFEGAGETGVEGAVEGGATAGYDSIPASSAASTAGGIAAAAAIVEGGPSMTGASAFDDGLGTPAPGGETDGNSAMITLLVKLGASLEAQDAEGCTPLHISARRGNHLAVDTLLMLGARIYAVNIRGHSALHMAAFHHHLPVVRQLVRFDAEVGKLKYILDTSGRSAYDMAADPSTREALHTLWEACASGQLDLAQAVQRQASQLPPGAAAPWLPVRTWELTRVLKRSVLHCVITGAAKAMAKLRKEVAGGKKLQAPGAGMGNENRVAAALAEAIKQRKDRSEHAHRKEGTGLPPHKLSASAVHIVSGVGFRWIPVQTQVSPMPHPEYRAWGGRREDVVLTFPEPSDPQAIQQYVDLYAYVPTPKAHLAFIPQGILGDASRSEMAAQRVVPGSELTSSSVEKEFGRIVEFCIRAGADPNQGDIDGVTPLMLAARFGLLFIIRKLLARADPLQSDARGNNALHYADAFSQPTAADILRESTLNGDGEGSVLDSAPNADGHLPHEVQGTGLAIFPEPAERLLFVGRPPARSGALSVSRLI